MTWFDVCRLCKEPGGFKVHPEWASAMAQPGHFAVTAVHMAAQAAAARFQTLCASIRWIAYLGGCQIAMCLVADLMFALAIPFVVGVHLCSQ